ncbi:MAG: tRNA (guanosine(46)-N7)-methyltransferase TrmB [Muribaculaceae bacterium]|nr:tRNA (guanosine(46)-N7)-methyltransferase TrmB [Muribaculaceae bacterium]
MGKNKLKKFAEIEQLECVLQYPRERIVAEGFPFKGEWHSLFGNSNPIVLELGCGKGEYTVALAKRESKKNFIGIDIKGARLWSGAKTVTAEKISNAKFLRTEIENLHEIFDSGEVEEIWITFPDPQMQKVRKRLTSTGFIMRYGGFLKPKGRIHLKTDSPFLYEYTRRLVMKNNLEVKEDTADLYGSGLADPVKSIKTFYESQWLARGKTIKYISFLISDNMNLEEPETEDIEKDDYRAFSRHNPTINHYSSNL